MVSFVVFASDLFRNFFLGSFFFRVERREYYLPQMSIHWSHWQWVSGIEMMPAGTVRVFEHSGDAKLALNY